MIAWGAIVRDPNEKYKDLRMIRFIIKTGRGANRKEKYLVCIGYGERLSTVVMRAMEKGDVVLVAGTWVETVIKTKKGEKTVYECQVNFIIPQGLIGFLLDLYSMPHLRQMVENRDNEEADIWESD